MRNYILCIVFSFFVLYPTKNFSQLFHWAGESGGSSADYGQAISTDGSGNSYITGYFSGTATFGSTVLTSRGNDDIFISMYDASGVLQWVQQAGGTGTDQGFGIGHDASGNVYITGGYTGKAYFGTDSITSTGSTEIFISKLNSSGIFQWVKTGGGDGVDCGRGISVDASGNAFVTGYTSYSSLTSFGGVFLDGYYIDGSGLTSIFIAKFNTAGQLQWAKGEGGIGDEKAYGIDIDASGNSYITGYFSNTVDFTGSNTVSYGGTDIFIAKFNSIGTCQWIRHFGSVGSDYGYAITLNSSGISYITGYLSTSGTFGSYTTSSSAGEFYIAQCDVNGWPDWVTQSGTSGATGYGVACDANGNTYATGSLSGGGPFGLSGSGAFVARFNPSGNLQWAAKASSAYSSGVTGRGISTDTPGNAYLTGNFVGAGSFGTYVLPNSVSQDIFVAKISSLTTGTITGAPYCVGPTIGDTIKVPFTSTSNFNGGNIFTVQLSNSAGSFASPVSIGTLASITSGTITAVIPPGTSAGSGYRVRVISSSPYSEGSNNGSNIVIYTNPVVTITPANPAPICWGGSRTLNAGGANDSYAWTPANGLSSTYFATVQASPGDTTTYTLKGTNTTGCWDTATVTLIVNPLPIANAGPNVNVCKGSGVILSASGGSTYTWSPSSTLTGANTANPTASPTVNTIYTVTVTSAAGCTSTDAAQVTVLSLPVIDAGITGLRICPGSSYTMSASGGTAYTWHPGQSLNDSAIVNPIASPSAQTTYTVVGTGANGCTSSDNFTIFIGPIIVEAGNGQSITCGTSASLSAGTSLTYPAPISYSWSPSTGLSNTSIANPIASPTSTTTYYVTLTTGNGCAGMDSIVVTVTGANYNLSFTANQQLFIAPPFVVQFTNSTPNLSNYNFTWFFGDGTSVNSNNTTVFHQYFYNGTYDVTLIAVNISTGCTDTLFQGSYIFCSGGNNCPVTATLSAPNGTSGCAGDTLLLKANTAANYTYQWNFNGVPINGATDSIYNATISGLYAVSINNGSCTATSPQQSINFNSSPSTPTITPSGSITFCAGGSVLLQANSGYTTYLWNTGASTQNITATSSGIYSLTVTNANGCEAATSYTLNSSSLAPEDICVVSVDSASNKNIIIWEKPVSPAIDSFVVYKESSQSGVYVRVGSQAYNVFSTMIDSASSPAQQADRYKLSIIDSCGTETLLSSHHKTIHLTINAGAGVWNLIWSHYEGFSFLSYDIYRGTTPSNISYLTTIQSSLNSYTDLTPPSGSVYYQVRVVPPHTCTPTAKMMSPYSISRSNISTNNTSGFYYNTLGDDWLRVYPNPTTGVFTVEMDFVIEQDINITITNAIGQSVLNKNISEIKGSYLLPVDISTYPKGVYFIGVKTHNNTATRRIIVD